MKLYFVAAMTVYACNPRVPRPSVDEGVTDAQAHSFLYRALQDYEARPRASGPARDLSPADTQALRDYALECERATGISVPAFNCNDGVEVPGQGTVPAGNACDQPNVLNHQCDPGSRFQVLPGRTNDAVAVAHCRKVGLPVNDARFNDIAVIQYNKANGAVCFYQALTNLPAAVGAPKSPGSFPWMSPAATEATHCTACHDNGAFIRSGYLRQLKTAPHALPTSSTGYDNKHTPLRYVGSDFSFTRSWSISTANAPGDDGTPCDACHRIGVSNSSISPTQAHFSGGTALTFATFATAATQPSKNPHSATSPIWMRPGQTTYASPAEETATRFKKCAEGFVNSRFTDPPSGCRVEALGRPWGPYWDFSLQTGTALQPAPTGFTFLLAPNRDLVVLQRIATGTHSTEVHVLSAASNYQQFVLQTGTPLQETPGGFDFALGANRDLFIIQRVGTGTHSTEVHILSAASNYQQFIEHTGTPLQETPAGFDFLVAQNRDLFVLQRVGTGTHSTEVHILSAASGYQQFIEHTGTPLQETATGFSFGLASNRDLFAIQQVATGTRSTEVHVLSAASGYQQFSLHTGSVLHETPSDFVFLIAANRDVFAIRNAGSTSTEVHVLSAKP